MENGRGPLPSRIFPTKRPGASVTSPRLLGRDGGLSRGGRRGPSLLPVSPQTQALEGSVPQLLWSGRDRTHLLSPVDSPSPPSPTSSLTLRQEGLGCTRALGGRWRGDTLAEPDVSFWCERAPEVSLGGHHVLKSLRLGWFVTQQQIIETFLGRVQASCWQVAGVQ